MKKLITILLLLVISGAFAQTNPIPNYTFNDWVDYGDYEDPADWGSNNYITAQFGVKPVGWDTVAIEGLSARLMTKAGPDFNVPAVLCSEGYFDPNLVKCIGGFACSYPFIYFNGYAMYNPEGGDSAGIGVVLWRWITVQEKRDSIASATVKFGSTSSDFIFFSVPFTYSTLTAPDSANIIMTSTVDIGTNPPAGSKLRIDNLAFSDLATGVSELEPIEVSVYPNPAADYVNFHLPPTPDKHFVTVFDYFGRTIKQGYMPANEFSMSVADLAPGFYFLHVRNSEGVSRGTAAFEVQR